MGASEATGFRTGRRMTILDECKAGDDLMWSAKAKLSLFLAEASASAVLEHRRDAESAASAEEERKLALAHST
jgi:hypothetical protein